MYPALSAEIYKLRNSYPLWLALGGTAGVVFGFFALHLAMGQAWMPERADAYPWPQYFFNHYREMARLLLPLFIVIQASLACVLEWRVDAWKNLLTLPVPRYTIYGSKYLVLLGLFIAAHLVFMVGMLGTGALLGWLRPGTGLLDYPPDLEYLARLAFKTVVSILGLLALQLWISVRFPSFIVALTIGILCFVGASLLGPDYIFFPYVYPIFYPLATDIDNGAWWDAGGLVSAAYAVVFLCLGAWDFERRTLGREA